MIIQRLGSFCFLLLMLFFADGLKAQHITLLQQGKPTSIRGLSVVDDKTAWISGSKGYVALTNNGGKTWAWKQVKGFEQADFRGIEAFSAKEAVIMSSGTPALILKTINGGTSWQVKYRNTDTAYFFDAMAFANPTHGMVLGDPINGKFVLLETINGGESWNIFKNDPNALPGEAAFAASGTCLRFDNDAISIVTGGKFCRELVLYTQYYPTDWSINNVLIKHGKPTQGAFSISGTSRVIVGGDYKNDHSTDSVAQYYSYNGTYAGGSISLSKTPPSGFQSCVEWISGNTYLSTGTPGSNITTDNGETWVKIDSLSYNVCRKAKRGKLVLLAGSNGKIAVFKQ